MTETWDATPATAKGWPVPDVVAGPTASFEEYVVARGPWLLRVAFLLSGDSHLAQDLAQSTLVQTHRHWKRVRAADDPHAYVRRKITAEDSDDDR